MCRKELAWISILACRGMLLAAAIYSAGHGGGRRQGPDSGRPIVLLVERVLHLSACVWCTLRNLALLSPPCTSPSCPLAFARQVLIFCAFSTPGMVTHLA